MWHKFLQLAHPEIHDFCRAKELTLEGASASGISLITSKGSCIYDHSFFISMFTDEVACNNLMIIPLLLKYVRWVLPFLDSELGTWCIRQFIAPPCEVNKAELVGMLHSPFRLVDQSLECQFVTTVQDITHRIVGQIVPIMELQHQKDQFSKVTVFFTPSLADFLLARLKERFIC